MVVDTISTYRINVLKLKQEELSYEHEECYMSSGFG